MIAEKIAALDIGIARIGIAISNPDTGLAIPHSTIHLKNTPDPYNAIAQLLESLSIHRVVVGWPLELNGEEGPAIRRTRQFLVKLKRAIPNLKIYPQDERMSSCAAENSLKTLHTTGSHKKNLVDAMAAAIILQTYLDRS